MFFCEDRPHIISDYRNIFIEVLSNEFSKTGKCKTNVRDIGLDVVLFGIMCGKGIIERLVIILNILATQGVEN